VEKLMSQEVLLEQMKIIYEVMAGKIGNKFLAVGLYKPIILSMSKYYHHLYHGLVREKIDELSGRGHKETCLINVMFQLTLAFLHQIMENHHLLNKNTCEEYIADIEDLFFLNWDHYKSSIEAALGHKPEDCESELLSVSE